MKPDRHQKPRVGISSCLLGRRVRYDGRHKRDPFITGTLGRCVAWVPVCPEYEAGMGVPREKVRLTGASRRPRMTGEETGEDWTVRMEQYAKKQVGKIKILGLDGYIFKKDSPSCGVRRVWLYPDKGVARKRGTGLFARALMQACPDLPVADEAQLGQIRQAELFLAGVFAHHCNRVGFVR